MNPTNSNSINALEKRVQATASAILAAIAGYCLFRALGTPNHPYQLTLGALLTALGYHRGWFPKPTRRLEWGMVLLNFVLFCLLFKLCIGSGKRFPFFWLKYPAFGLGSPTLNEKSTFSLLPQLQWGWQNSALALWEVDFTLLQTFLAIATVVGAAFRFQPFASLAALLLLGASLPAFLEFNWDWILPGLITSAVAIYLQATAYERYTQKGEGNQCCHRCKT